MLLGHSRSRPSGLRRAGLRFVPALDANAIGRVSPGARGDVRVTGHVEAPGERVALARREPDACRHARRGRRQAEGSEGGGWLREFWVPHRSELLRIEAGQVERIDAERDYVRLHIRGNDGGQDQAQARSYLLLQTIAGLEARLDPERFIRIHRSTILRRDVIRGLRHEGLGVWSAELGNGEALRIGRTYLRKVKAMAGR